VTSTGIQLVLRLPVWARVWALVFPVFFACMFLFAFRPQDGPVWLGALAAFVLSPLLSWRLFRLAVVGTAEGTLVVRNHWRDRTLRREDIAEVTVGRGVSANSRSVRLRLQDGSTVRLDATENQFGRQRIERQADEVRAWVTGQPQPFL
jgi:hypothetical protein